MRIKLENKGVTIENQKYSNREIRKAIWYTVPLTLLLAFCAWMTTVIWVRDLFIFAIPFLWAKRVYEWYYQREPKAESGS